jgi:hypothetical protein
MALTCNRFHWHVKLVQPRLHTEYVFSLSCSICICNVLYHQFGEIPVYPKNSREAVSVQQEEPTIAQLIAFQYGLCAASANVHINNMPVTLYNQ